MKGIDILYKCVGWSSLSLRYTFAKALPGLLTFGRYAFPKGLADSVILGTCTFAKALAGPLAFER